MSNENENKPYQKTMLNIFDEYVMPLNPMSKFAPVCPYHIYQQFSVNGYIPETILLLAHDVVAHKEGYEETFSNPVWNDTTIIMDNSLVELKDAVPIDVVYEASEIVAADIVVLPDVMGDGKASAELTLESWDEWNYKFKDCQKMVALHGSSMSDWLASAELLASKIDPDWIALPRKLETPGDFCTRASCIAFTNAIFGHKPIHLLGFSDYIWKDLWAAMFPDVRSIDSAVPLRLSTTNILSEDAGPRGDWWDKATFNKGMIDRCMKVDEIIRTLIS